MSNSPMRAKRNALAIAREDHVRMKRPGPPPGTPEKAPFSTDYKERLFMMWYKAGKPEITSFCRKYLIEDENGHTPTKERVTVWANREGWRERAGVMDAEVSRELENMAIQEKIAMFKRHAEIGKTVMEKGFDFLETEGFDKASDALKAIFDGAELEKASVGIPQALLKLSSMTDTQLSSLIENLIGGKDMAELLSPEESDDEVFNVVAEDVTDEVEG